MAIPKFETQETETYHPKKKHKSNSSLFPLVVLVLLLTVAVGALGYMYYNSKKDFDELKSQKVLGDTTAEYNEIVEKIKQFIVIGDDEKVNIAKIDNPDTLKEQDPEFYANVQTGQYLIVLPKSQRVLVYDKETNKVINFSSYTIKVNLIDESTIEASEKPLKIEIRYTSKVTEDTLTKVQQALENASSNYKIVGAVRATKDDYTGLTLVLLNKTNKPKMSQNIVAHTGTNSILDSMPEGEATSGADVVLILGNQ